MRSPIGPVLAAFLSLMSPMVAVADQPADVDYFSAPFEIRRVLDWGDRPDWSPDGNKIAFTESDTEQGYAYEMDLRTRKVRCLTCEWGTGGLVTRIYYLPDESFLIEAGPDDANTELYWMPASLSSPPQALEAKAVGEVAISRHTLPDGGFRIAWGVARDGLWTGELGHDGSRAVVDNRRLVYQWPSSESLQSPGARWGWVEPYNFVKNDQALTFYTIDTLNGDMYEVDLRTGAVTNQSRDPAHNETHVFPDERFGLEESNRVSDPEGPLRGVSGHSMFGGRPFDLFVVAFDGSQRVRRLTHVSDIGGEANQSFPAPDGRRIAFTLDAPSSGPFAGKSGLYVGEFLNNR